jgi:hypothetical protein
MLVSSDHVQHVVDGCPFFYKTPSVGEYVQYDTVSGSEKVDQIKVFLYDD